MTPRGEAGQHLVEVPVGDAVLGEIRRVQQAGLSEGCGEDAPVEAGIGPLRKTKEIFTGAKVS
ncbi:hypothetical protein [Actinoplanes sp. DH11]|uniref:hypothetical protein n=1 Tax=Actinoplanes sp. DH11 TaxID=2857011 RepID=UPI001E6503EC